APLPPSRPADTGRGRLARARLGPLPAAARDRSGGWGPRRGSLVDPGHEGRRLKERECAAHAEARAAYSTFSNGHSASTHALTLRQSETSSSARSPRTHDSTRASYPLSGSG